jgi:phospholipid transport system substrate-binding protein
MRIVLFILLSFICSLTNAADSVETNPNQVIRSVSDKTFARITDEKNKLTSDPTYMQVIIEEELMPFFDYKYASYKVMGSHLQDTTIEQRNAFVEAFKHYLINAYGHILYEYDQQKVEIQDNDFYEDKGIISIPVRIIDENDKITQISFKLRKNKNTGEWKVFDVIAEGISMLDTKQSEFAELLHKKGVDHVIELLQTKNSEF